jgi:hypothetical protein
MDTQAQKIVENASDAAHAMDMAEFDIMLKEIEQEWNSELTSYYFTDGSRLVVSGVDYTWAKQ